MISFKKRTKIICTIGPVSADQETLEKLIKNGMNVARLNFSHGSYDSHAGLIKNIRAAAKKLNQPVAILQDLQGPRIRIGEVAGEGLKTKKGDQVALVAPKLKNSARGGSTSPASLREAGRAGGKKIKNYSVVPIQYENLYKDVKKG
ncbi:MAG TPA: pyruvate kinase, partial [Patescibacteria group bacterium]